MATKIQTPPPTAGFIGQGVTYPLTLDTATGRLKLSWGPDLISQSILSLELTQPGERVMQPGYGAASTTFEPVDSDRHRLVLMQNISEYEPRAAQVTVDTQLKPTGEIVETVGFSVPGEASTRTLTYPLFTPPTITGASQ